MNISTNRNTDDHYSGAQITLHWAVVVLVVVQLLSHEAMEHAFDRLKDAGRGGLPSDPIALVHAISGLAVLVLMAARIMLRMRLGAPALPSDMPRAQQLAAHATHIALYALLVVLPLSGAAAILLGNETAANLHRLLVALLWIVIGLHVAGALYHALVRRDGVIWRILVPRP